MRRKKEAEASFFVRSNVLRLQAYAGVCSALAQWALPLRVSA